MGVVPHDHLSDKGKSVYEKGLGPRQGQPAVAPIPFPNIKARGAAGEYGRALATLDQYRRVQCKEPTFVPLESAARNLTLGLDKNDDFSIRIPKRVARGLFSDVMNKSLEALAGQLSQHVVGDLVEVIFGETVEIALGIVEVVLAIVSEIDRQRRKRIASLRNDDPVAVNVKRQLLLAVIAADMFHPVWVCFSDTVEEDSTGRYYQLRSAHQEWLKREYDYNAVVTRDRQLSPLPEPQPEYRRPR